jgi:hypothetical protein
VLVGVEVDGGGTGGAELTREDMSIVVGGR